MSQKVSNLDILRRAVKKHGYSSDLLDSAYSKAIYVTNGERYFIARSKTRFGMYPINYKFAEHLVDDKALTKRVLKKFGFRVIRGKQFHISAPIAGTKVLSSDTVSASYKYAKKIKYPVFVKPNNGSRGANARIIFNETGLRKHVAKMKKDGVSSYLVEKFTSRAEYRIFVVGGKPQFMYKKQRASIIGTGLHTIQELISQAGITPDEYYLNALLRWEKKTMRTVLKHKKELTMQETANISLGAKITDYSEKIPKSIHEWTKHLYNTVGLEVFAVDVFVKGRPDETNKFLIIEINSNPALAGIYSKGHQDKAFEIWGKVMKKFFARR